MIGEPRFRLERLSEYHRRAFFKCAREPALERYLVDDNRAPRENQRSISAVHVLLDTDNDDKIAGYFTLANTSVVPESVPKNIARKLPRYDRWPAALLGRMARDDDYGGHDLGIILVALAFRQALEIAKRSGMFALVVDAKNDRLTNWYEGVGFQRFVDKARTLFIMNQTMQAYLDRLEVSQQNS